MAPEDIIIGQSEERAVLERIRCLEDEVESLHKQLIELARRIAHVHGDVHKNSEPDDTY